MRSLSQGELSQLREFLARGGELVLLDNGIFMGNELLRELGIRAGFTGATILDPLFNGLGDELPMAFVNLGGSRLVLVMNNASVIWVGEAKVSIIGITSNLSRLVNGSRGPFPVIVKVPYGSGSVLLISSPGLLMNSMLGFGDNQEFLEKICSGGRVVFLEATIARATILYSIKLSLFSLYSPVSLFKYLVPMIPVLIAAVVLLRRGGGGEGAPGP
jgi:hypothetical protein